MDLLQLFYINNNADALQSIIVPLYHISTTQVQMQSNLEPFVHNRFACCV